MNRNMNARNFGLKSRDIKMAAKNALREGMESFSSIATMSSRFNQFTEWEKDTHGVKDLRWIERNHVEQYAEHIANRVKAGELAVSTAKNYLSAVNRVMEIARADKNVHVKLSDYLSNRTGICTTNKAFTNSEIKKLFNSSALTKLTPSQATVGRLSVLFSLRFKEASLLNIKKALKEAIDKKSITVIKGTKGGRKRHIPIRKLEQIKCLEQAVQLQDKGRSLIPVNMNYKQWKSAANKALEKSGISGWHGGRHLYAQSLYHHIAKVQPPIVAGIAHGRSHVEYISKQLNISIKAAKKVDKDARKIVAEELGHRRISITNSYLG